MFLSFDCGKIITNWCNGASSLKFSIPIRAVALVLCSPRLMPLLGSLQLKSWNLDSNGYAAQQFSLFELSCPSLQVRGTFLCQFCLAHCANSAHLQADSTCPYVPKPGVPATFRERACLLCDEDGRDISASAKCSDCTVSLRCRVPVQRIILCLLSSQAKYDYTMAALRVVKTAALIQSVEFSASGSADLSLNVELKASIDQRTTGELPLLTRFPVHSVVDIDVAGVHVSLGVYLDLKFRYDVAVSAAGSLATGAHGPLDWTANYKYISGSPDEYSIDTDSVNLVLLPLRANLDAGGAFPSAV